MGVLARLPPARGLSPPHALAVGLHVSLWRQQLRTPKGKLETQPP